MIFNTYKNARIFWIINTFKKTLAVFCYSSDALVDFNSPFYSVNFATLKKPIRELNINLHNQIDVLQELGSNFTITIPYYKVTPVFEKGTVHDLLKLCTEQLIMQKRLTKRAEQLVFERYETTHPISTSPLLKKHAMQKTK